MKTKTFRTPWSAGEIWPDERGERVALAGLRARVRELLVADVGTLERELARLAPDRWAHAREPAEAVKAAKRAGNRAVHNRALHAMYVAETCWPPRLGSGLFGRLLASPEGLFVYLWVALSRDHPALTVRRCRALGNRMGRADWRALDRVLWGHPDWGHGGRQADPEDDEDDEDDDDGPGRDWGSDLNVIMRVFGMTPREVGRLTVSQFEYVIACCNATEKSPPLRATTGPDPKLSLVVPDEELGGYFREQADRRRAHEEARAAAQAAKPEKTDPREETPR